jgi:hypothetical protein
VRVDSARNLTYVVGSSRVEILHGTHVAGVVSLGRTGADEPRVQSSALTTSNGDLYVGTAGRQGAVTVLRGTRVLGTVHDSARVVVANQRTGVAYVERKTGSGYVIELLSGPTVIGSLTTTASLTGWDPVTGAEIGSAPTGLVAIRGRHVVQTVKVGAGPRVVDDVGSHRLYTVAGTTLSVLRTAS